MAKGALATAYISVAADTGTASTAVSALSSSLSSGMRAAGNSAGTSFLSGFLAPFTGGVSGILGPLWGAITALPGMIVGFIGSVASTITSAITAPFRAAGDIIKTALGVALGQMIFGSLQGIAGNLSEMVNTGMAFNAEMETTKASLEVMLGSVGQAKRLLADMTEFAAKTPFELGDLTKSATALLATKKIAASQVIPTIRKLGDAAAGSSDGFASMPRIVRAVTQMLGKGKIQAEEMMQLAEAGVPAWSILAEKMGLSTAEVQEMAKKGKLGSKDVLTLIDALGGRFEGLAEKQSTTFSGLQSTLKDLLKIRLAQVFKPIFDLAKLQLSGLVAFLDSDTGTGLFNFATGIVQSFVDGVMAAQQFGSEIVSSVMPTLMQIQTLLVEIGTNVGDTFASIGASLGGEGVQAGVTAFVQSFLSGIRNILDWVSLLTTNWDLTWQLIQATANYAAIYLTDQFNAAMAGIFAGVSAIANNIIVVFQGLLSSIPGVLGQIAKAGIDIFASMFDAIGRLAKTIFTDIVDAISGVFGFLQKIATEGLSAVSPAEIQKLADSLNIGFAAQAGAAMGKSAIDSVVGQTGGASTNKLIDPMMAAAAAFSAAAEGSEEQKAARAEMDRLVGEMAAARNEQRQQRAMDEYNQEKSSEPMEELAGAAADEGEKQKLKKMEFFAFDAFAKDIQKNLGKASAEKKNEKNIEEIAKETKESKKIARQQLDADVQMLDELKKFSPAFS